MDESSELEPQKSIERPDIKDPDKLEGWLSKRIRKPYLGFEEKKHEDGTSWTLEEQIEASKQQMRNYATEWQEDGYPDEVIQDLIIDATEGLDKVEETK